MGRYELGRWCGLPGKHFLVSAFDRFDFVGYVVMETDSKEVRKGVRKSEIK